MVLPQSANLSERLESSLAQSSHLYAKVSSMVGSHFLVHVDVVLSFALVLDLV